MERVSVPVATRAPTGQTNAYVIGESSAILIDPGAVDDAIDTIIDTRCVEHIAVTHTHPDHVGGVAHYAAETNATVWARHGYTTTFEQKTGISPDTTFREDTVIPGDPPVEVVDLPGHAADHVGFSIDTPDGTAMSIGDLAGATGSVFIGSEEGDMRAYYTSLRRLLAQSPAVLYPGHGPPITAVNDRLTAVLAHRRMRERRIEAAVQGGAETVATILEAAYSKELSGVRDLAAETVRAHLEKLDREGRLTWDGTRAHPV